MAVSLDILSIVLIVILCQGIFVMSVLALRYRLRPSQHLFLFLIVLCLFWFQAEFLAIRTRTEISFGLFFGTRYGAWFLLGPLFHFYIRAIEGKSWKWGQALGHLCPFLIFGVVVPLFTTEMVGSQQVHYGMLSTFYSPFREEMLFLQKLYAGLYALQFVHLAVYLVTSYLSLRKYDQALKGSYSQIDTNTIGWLITLNILLLVTVAFASSYLAIVFARRSYNRTFDYVYVIPMSLFTYLVSYRLSGVTWARADATIESSKYSKTALKPEVALKIKAQLEQYIIQAKPFLNPELRLQDLADHLEVPLHHLSQVINENFGMSFFDLINRFRVEEAKRLIEVTPDAPLLEVAFRAGFNNKTSFNNAFKKFTTQTAAEFKKSVRSR